MSWDSLTPAQLWVSSYPDRHAAEVAKRDAALANFVNGKPLDTNALTTTEDRLARMTPLAAVIFFAGIITDPEQ